MVGDRGIGVSIALNVVLVGRLGATGTAAAMLGGQIVAVAVAWATARRHPRATVWTRPWWSWSPQQSPSPSVARSFGNRRSGRGWLWASEC